jgi:hypothetical protein
MRSFAIVFLVNHVKSVFLKRYSSLVLGLNNKNMVTINLQNTSLGIISITTIIAASIVSASMAVISSKDGNGIGSVNG